MKIQDWNNPSYKDISIEDFVLEAVKHGDNYYLNESENDNDMFKEFLVCASCYYGDDFTKDNKKELIDNKQEVLKYLKEYKNNAVIEFMEEEFDSLVETLKESFIDCTDFTEDFYIPSDDILSKAKQETIKQLYNEYCK